MAPAVPTLSTAGVSAATVCTAVASAVSIRPVTSALARAHQEQRVRRKCPRPGCSGQEHKSLARWAEGHTTRSGWPSFHNEEVPAPQ